ncbi:MAG TPA: DNA polymerase III subunit delta [Acidimicrobiales bacterium]|nr:DNA polymerase III subunit delta [Acidimicrobiales bacterium]
MEAPVYLVRGDDASLVAQSARELVEQLVGDRDPALVVEEHGGPAADELDVGIVVDACTTPPFLVDRRVVVVRDAGRLAAGGAARLVAYVQDPLPSTVLVLVAGGGTIPPALPKAVAAAGVVIDTAVGTGRERKGWLAERLREAPVHLDAAAAGRLGDHLGDDLGRLAGILGTLAVVYGEGATVGIDEVEPFLGEAGSVPPWDLTDAINAGSTADALAALHRMLGPGGRAAPEIVAMLHRHFASMLRLDGADVASDEEAARLLGVRSAFVAQKARAQGQRLGSERVGRAVTLIADADVDVKGRTGLPPELVLEVLVARLSRLGPARRSRRR